MTELTNKEQAGLIASNLAVDLGLPELLEALIDDPKVKMMHYFHFLINIEDIIEAGDIRFEDEGFYISEHAKEYLEDNLDHLKESLGLAPSKVPAGATIH